ncbi:MAG: membrane fusion protein (multidrug efflux system) [Granulosicoccus sp.]|jgi:membrane fusion protein (multidrug efflux system)
MNSVKYIIGIVALASLIACGGEETLESKKALLDQKKVALATLENEISKLKTELESLDSTSTKKEEDAGILVELKNIQPELFNHKVEVNGVIQAEQIANVSPEMGGQILSVSVKEGDNVTKGQALARLNTAVLQSSLSEIDNGIELATTVYERQSRLWEQKIGSEIQYLQAKNNLENLQKKKETLQTQVGMGTIKAPFNGVVDKVWMKAGEMAAPGMPLITVVDMSKMKVLADVSERYAAVVKKNAMVDVNFPSFGMELKAPIRTVGNVINPLNRSFSVEITVPNPEKTLKPNGMATILIEDFAADSAMVVPAIVVGRDQKGDFLYVTKSEGGTSKAYKTYVTTGMTSNGKTMVTTGLASGDNVVVAGYNEIASGDIVRVQP